MGLINNALFIGRSALTTYQSALQIIGNNITNAGNPNYVRQNPTLSRIASGTLPGGFMPGNGVQLSALQRHVDEALEARLRTSFGDRESAAAEQQGLDRLESIVNELSDEDLSSRLDEFFGAFSALHSDPASTVKRRNVVQMGQALVQEIQRQRSEANLLRDEVNDRIVFLTDRANEVLSDVADLNVQINEAESGGNGTASALRDQRDALLRELSGIINVTTREQENGAVNVYIGNEAVVQFGSSRGLTTTTDLANGVENVTVRFADNNAVADIRSGELEGLINARDQHTDGHLSALDNLALALIREVNIVHAGGQGLSGMSAATGTYGATDPAQSLATANNGLAFVPQNGSFQIRVTDSAGATTTTDIFVRIGVDGVTDTTLNDLATALTGVTGITATVTTDGKLSITADSGSTFSFANDTSSALAALGINTFFVGRDASDLHVNSTVANDLNLIAAARDGTAGDGSNAAALADVLNQPSSVLNNVSIGDYYNQLASGMAVTGAAASSTLEASEAIVNSLVAQREAVSGVNLDEEALQLIKFERAFQGASRYITVVDGLIAEMLNLVR